MSKDDIVRVHWYDHDCPWITKYCDEHHTRGARRCPWKFWRSTRSATTTFLLLRRWNSERGNYR